MIHRSRRAKHLRKGSEVIELAFLLLPLLWLTFGAIDFGYYFYLQHNLEGAAREGARAGAPYYKTSTDVKAAVDKMMFNAGFKDPSQYTVSYPDGTAEGVAAGDPFTVKVEMSYSPMGVPPARVQANKVSGSATFRKEEG